MVFDRRELFGWQRYTNKERSSNAAAFPGIEEAKRNACLLHQLVTELATDALVVLHVKLVQIRQTPLSAHIGGKIATQLIVPEIESNHTR